MTVLVEPTPIPGLVILRLPVHADARGWFKENWQRATMVAAGLPDFEPVQNNVSFNAKAGVTRGVHAEPWDKLVSVVAGRVFAAWIDLREGEAFGATFHLEVDPTVSVFVPRGVGNAYQALEDGTVYNYLVNDHWRPGVTYPAVALDDPASAIPWPIPVAQAQVSPKDRENPTLDGIRALSRGRRTLILGCHGQLGRALQQEFTDADCADLEVLDITEPGAVAAWPWHEYDVVLNAAAYTAVDAAEHPEHRRLAWTANAAAPAALARIARLHRLTLVHYSSDYVFDGSVGEHDEDEPVSPLGVYGQSKAAGDLAVATAPRHYLIRTSWVVGDGRNFVRTMQSLAAQGASPSVVDDQVGRLTFTAELSRATRHLLDTPAPYGTYNVTNGGDPMSWADVAAAVLELSGRRGTDVRRITTREFARGRDSAPRPALSTLSLAKIRGLGFEPEDAMAALERYCAAQPALPARNGGASEAISGPSSGRGQE